MGIEGGTATITGTGEATVIVNGELHLSEITVRNNTHHAISVDSAVSGEGEYALSLTSVESSPTVVDGLDVAGDSVIIYGGTVENHITLPEGRKISELLEEYSGKTFKYVAAGDNGVSRWMSAAELEGSSVNESVTVAKMPVRFLNTDTIMYRYEKGAAADELVDEPDFDNITYPTASDDATVQWYKKVLQTLVYVPHFVSMVVIASITFMLVKTPSMEGMSGGALYEIVKSMTGKNLNALGSPIAIYWVLLIQNIWKETGWGTIIFLAALAGVDVEQYEAAIVDGASRFQQLIYITLPAIMGTVVTMFILRMGSVLDTGFEQIILMQNDLNRITSETFDTYVYQIGRVQGNYGYSTAVSLFKSVISIICIQTANRLAKKAGQDGLF